MNRIFGMFELSRSEALIIVAIAALAFGKSKFPGLANKITDTMKEANKATAGAEKIRKKVDSQLTDLKDDLAGREKA